MRQSLRISVLALAVVILAALALPFAAAAPRIEPTKLVVTVYYKTDAGKSPLDGVEVFTLIDGTPRYRCTNANGKAVFDDVGSGVWLKTLATGPSVHSPRCSNTLFLNPDNGKQMFAVLYKNHQGVQITDSVLLSSGRQALKLVAKTPFNQRRICAGFKVTILGTPGIDGLIGTSSNDVINGRGGDDVIDGFAGEDIICGGPGADVISGGTDDDFLWGGGGADSLAGNGGTDFLDGGRRSDTCTTGENLFSCEK